MMGRRVNRNLSTHSQGYQGHYRHDLTYILYEPLDMQWENTQGLDTDTVGSTKVRCHEHSTMVDYPRRRGWAWKKP